MEARLFKPQSLISIVIVGIIVFSAVSLFSGCELLFNDDKKEDNIIVHLDNFLSSKPPNTEDTPYYYKLNINSNDDLIKLRNTISSNFFNGRNRDKYVHLDLSDSTITEFPRNAFNWCFTLVEITIPKNMTSIGDWAFFGCGLTRITIPDNVTSIGIGAFRGCSFAKIVIGNSVESIGDMAFSYCNSLTDITIPDNVTRIGSGVFLNCTELNSVTIGNGVKSIGENAFNGCDKLTAINIANDNEYYLSENGVLYNRDKTTLIKYPADKTGVDFIVPSSVTVIEQAAFYNCNNLTNITIGNNVTEIGDWTFSFCINLTNVTFAPTSKVTSIGDNAFAICNNLINLTIPNGVSSIGKEAFNACVKLTSLTIPNSVNTIKSRAFDDCLDLTSVTFEGTINSNNFNSNIPFPGDLRAKFYETDQNNGTSGTYTRESGSNTWQKQ